MAYTNEHTHKFGSLHKNIYLYNELDKSEFTDYEEIF